MVLAVHAISLEDESFVQLWQSFNKKASQDFHKPLYDISCPFMMHKYECPWRNEPNAVSSASASTFFLELGLEATMQAFQNRSLYFIGDSHSRVCSILKQTPLSLFFSNSSFRSAAFWSLSFRTFPSLGSARRSGPKADSKAPSLTGSTPTSKKHPLRWKHWA